MKISELIKLIESKTGKKIILKEAKVTTKDFERMLDLHLSNSSAKQVADKIKDKEKAMVRFVAGLKISGDKELKFNKNKY